MVIEMNMFAEWTGLLPMAWQKTWAELKEGQ